MAWQEPKTDWHGEYVNGEYVGDYFKAEDFNRIKNNIEHLWSLAVEKYGTFDIDSMGADRTPADYIYASDINTIEDNFETINNNTIKADYGTKPVYVDNGNTMDFNELNRLESAMLNLYNTISEESGT